MARIALRNTVVTLLVGAVVLGVDAPASARVWKGEGCGVEYWLSHPTNWEEYPTTFRVSDAWHMRNLPDAERRLTFIEALADPGVAATPSRQLLRSAVAAYLNAAHEGLAFPYRRFRAPYHIRVAVNNAIASNDARQQRRVANDLDYANNGTCPLK